MLIFVGKRLDRLLLQGRPVGLQIKNRNSSSTDPVEKLEALLTRRLSSFCCSSAIAIASGTDCSDTSVCLSSFKCASASVIVRDLGVTLDSELTLADHISLLTRSCFYQLRRLRAIRRSVSPKVFLTIVHAFICTHIDYCNSLLIGLPKTRLAPVQYVLNAAARMIARLPPYSHISDCMINELHWLPILARVRYKGPAPGC